MKKKELKFCKDCEYSSGEIDTCMKCIASQNPETLNLVTGLYEYDYKYCEQVRENNNLCGRKGKWFKKGW